MLRIKGVIPAMPTPLLANEDIDIPSVAKLVDFVLQSEVGGILVLGTMGEGTALVDSQKKVLLTEVVKCVNGRVPVLAGISEISTRRTLESGKLLQDCGPDCLVTVQPFYYKFPHPDSILEFVTTLCDNLSTPIAFYNQPGNTGNPVSVDTLDKIINLPKVIALKDVSCNFGIFMELMRRYPDKEKRPASILQGDESLFDASLSVGADGIVSGGGTVMLDLLVDLYKAGIAHDTIKASKLQKKFYQSLLAMLGPELLVDWMCLIKNELKKKGVCDNNVTSPFLKRV